MWFHFGLGSLVLLAVLVILSNQGRKTRDEAPGLNPVALIAYGIGAMILWPIFAYVVIRRWMQDRHPAFKWPKCIIAFKHLSY